jgi:hypothetical protein
VGDRWRRSSAERRAPGTFDSLEMMRSFHRTRMPARQRERSCALSLLASRLGDMRSDIYFGFATLVIIHTLTHQTLLLSCMLCFAGRPSDRWRFWARCAWLKPRVASLFSPSLRNGRCQNDYI